MRQMRSLAPTGSGRLSGVPHQERRWRSTLIVASASKGFRKKRKDGGGTGNSEEAIKSIDNADIANADAAQPLRPPPFPSPTAAAADPSAIAASSAAFAAAMSLAAAAIRAGGSSLGLAGLLPSQAGAGTAGAAGKAAAAALLSAPLLGDAAAPSPSPSALAAHAGAALAAAAVVTGFRAAAVAAGSSSSDGGGDGDGGEESPSSSSSYASEFDASLALVLPRLSAPQVALWLCLLPAIAEEALFRGGLLPLVSADWRGASAVALLFGVLHFSPRAGRGVASAAVAAGAGFLYGGLYVWTGGDLVATAGSHALANAGSAALWWSREEGRKEKRNDCKE